MPKKVLVFLAEGFEEVEAITPIDYLRRAGIEVTVAAVNKGPAVKGSHGIQVATDASLDDLAGAGKLKPSSWDAVVVPGGLPGADNLAASKRVGDFLKGMAEAGKLVAAICASPARVLAPLGLLVGKKFTCYPGEEKNISPSMLAGADWKQDRVVIDGNLVTSRGAGTAGEFAAAIIGELLGAEEAKKLADKVLL
ncbi:MAG: DJ-1/PfpI family protein [Treponema sp.]|jgi:4-methyl-5(b-hydroxyethyl)-thiazole monophosphate biosynthesis|nr:DJ-1/PfpI family protein [Treponema sp.]